jgi:general L-amino acid transport system permease protein
MADQTDKPETQPVNTMQTTGEEPVTADPPAMRTAKALLKENLFKDVKNSIVTLVFGAILVYLVWQAIGFVFFNEKVAQDGTVRSGWEVVKEGPLVVYMVGNRFNNTGTPFSMVWAGVMTIGLAMGFAVGTARDPEAPPMKRSTKLGIIIPPLIGVVAILSMTTTILPTLLTLATIAVFFVGRVAATSSAALRHKALWILLILVVLAFGLLTNFQPDNVNDFGGLLLTIVVSFAAIVLSFPLGVIAALARRSSFPLIRPVAVAYIEFIRGVPLITLLFMAVFALGFLFPPGMQAPGVIPRAIIMITLFTGAYVAEVVRGGLQSVPKGQTEAGQALGLSPVKITSKIVLPQALRNSIPALIGQFISLIKDTSLLAIVGVLEILGVTEPILSSLRFSNQGFTAEAYVFVGFVYWIICFSLSRASQRLETRLGVGTR